MGVRGKEAYTVRTTNIISQWQYFVAHCLSSYVSNVLGLYSTFSFHPQANDIGEAPSLVVGTVLHVP
jgi:hypothetical protein